MYTKSERNISASCHCGAFKLSVDVDASTLPQGPYRYCHCTSCRRRTGQFANVPFILPKAWEPSAEQLSALREYKTHRGAPGPVSSYFCTTCGAKVFLNTISEGWKLSPGLIQGSIEGLMQIKGHSWVGDTKDGGLADMIFPEDDPRYIGEDKDSGIFLKEQTATETTASVDSQYLPIHCDCNAFSLFISRPAPNLPLPKNCYWYRPPMDGDTGLPTRFMATFCGCTSCRTSSGSMMPAHPWVQIPFVDLHAEDKQTGAMKPFLSTTVTTQPSDAVRPLESGIALGTDIPGLTLYRSSAENARYHCSTCGATVLYFDSSRPWLGTWAAALLDDSNGVRAERWLSWWTGQDGHPVGSVHCYEEAYEHDAVGAQRLKKGLEAWGRKLGQRK